MLTYRSRSRGFVTAGVVLSITIAVVGQSTAGNGADPAMADAPVRAGQAETVRALEFEHIDYFSGAITGVAVEKFTAYISRGVNLEALDVANPLAPRLLGRSAALPGLARVVAVSDGLVYLVEAVRRADTTGVDRLYIVDVSDPTAPELRGRLELPKNSLMGVAVSDGWLYCAAKQSGLLVIDVHDPTQPRLVATVATDKPAKAVALADATLLVGVSTHANDGGLRVFDRTDPEAPRLIGSVDVGQEGNAVVSVGRYALLATWENVFVIDMADPARPQVAHQIGA